MVVGRQSVGGVSCSLPLRSTVDEEGVILFAFHFFTFLNETLQCSVQQ